MEKLSLLHYLKTDKSEYFVYNIKVDTDKSAASVCVERRFFNRWRVNRVRILEQQIEQASYGMLCGESFSRFVGDCLGLIRDHIRDRGEFIIEDKKI